MAAPRSEHTATFLGTGKVLLAGGANAGGRLATAELFDPATGAFTATVPMPEARSGHTATMLPTGKVLVVGGDDASGALATCRLYDPRTEAWTTTGSMATARREHTATLLANGKVLVTGGHYGSLFAGYTVLASAELYDPALGTWTATGALGSARSGHAATLLEDGKVLVAGGQTRWLPLPAQYTATAEIYDPGTAAWSATGPMTEARRSFTLTRIPGGLVVAAGGKTSSPLSTAERYNVSTEKWASAGDLGAARSGHAAALLPDSRVLLVGGTGALGTLGTVVQYSPGPSTWHEVETGGARADHTATLLPGGRVLVVGGERTGWLSDAEIVDRMVPAWTTVGTTWGRADGTATLLPNGKVLLLGKVASGDATRGALFDPETGTFAATTGAMVAPRSKHTATLLSDGDVLILGGVNGAGTLVAQDEIYDPVTDTFTALAVPLPTRRAEHAAVLLPDGRVLVAGGQSPSMLVPYVYSGGIWTAVTDTTGTPGYGISLTLLSNGHVLLASDGDVFLFDPFPGPASTRWRTMDTSGAASGEPVLLPSGDVLFCKGYPYLEYVLWDVETSSFREPFPEASLPVRLQRGFRALALPDGRVLVTGGYGGESGVDPLSLVVILDPATGVTTVLPSMAEERARHTMTLLPNGRVLVAGGIVGNTTTIEPTVETLRLWPGLGESSRPAITSWSAELSLPASFVLGGTGFLGIGEATGGNGSTSSSVGFPSVLLRRIEGGFSRWIPSFGDAAFGATAFTSSEVSGIPGGHYLVTLIASGIPSKSKVVVVSPCEIYVGVMGSTADASVCVGETLRLEARILSNVSNVSYTWTLPDGSTYGPNSSVVIPDAQVEDGGFYTVVATREGCVGPLDTVEVRVAPPGQMPIITAPFVLLHGQEGEASVEWQLGSSWTWTLSGGSIVSGQGTNRIRFRAATEGDSMTITVVEAVGEGCDQPPSMAVVELELPATEFYPVTPCRLFDTRNAEGPDEAAPAFAPGETRILYVGTRCGLTSSVVRALSVNQTVTQPVADGELVVYRGGLATVPDTSSISFRAGKTRANNGILELSRAGNGTIRVHNRSAGTVHFILDVNGVFK